MKAHVTTHEFYVTLASDFLNKSILFASHYASMSDAYI